MVAFEDDSLLILYLSGSTAGRAIRHHLHTTLPTAVCFLIRRPCYTTTTYNDKAASLLTAKLHPPKWEHDPDYRKWEDKEAEIFRDVDPITLLVKHILHSGRYMDGEQLTSTDEKLVVERLLS
ncbi:hypothetical protein SSX86_014080 [Deinandra increscens subsp. villosa]|uniref:Uncharacterized protein n=1 Tax=Deinandra increscens subsp. villosa TaxID=3103831 RepID=A0AAP0D5S1_9ASTR